MVVEDGAVGRACDPEPGEGGEHGAAWVRLDARWCVRCGTWWHDAWIVYGGAEAEGLVNLGCPIQP